MEFGKLPDISGIDLRLAPDHGGTARVLGGVRPSKINVFVGAPVWADEGFPGKIYPAKAKGKDFVKHYGKQFNSIELNATHYRVPDPDTIRKWASEVPAGFRFCPKIHQSISHAGSLTHMIPHMKDLMGSLDLFGDRLGMPFLQLPPQFHTGRLDELLTFLDGIMIRELAIELRHESWFVEEAPMKLLCNYLYKNNLCLGITDVAGRRDVLHQRLTCRKAFIRFVANDLHPTDFERMQDWALRLQTWIGLGLEELYFFVHTPTKSLTPELAIYFIREFNRLTGLKLAPPKIIEQSSDPQTLF